MNHPVLTRLLWLVVLPALLCFGGCAVPASQPVSNGKPEKLFQLNDEQWVDLSDVREIVFFRSDAAAIATGSDPFAIAIWHHGASDNPFRFTFTDAAKAYDSWRRLTGQLGGSLRGDSWTPNANPTTAQVVGLTPPPEPPAPRNDNSPYSIFREDLSALAACRDEKWITPQEYQRAHDQKVADFVASVGSNSGYNANSESLYQELLQLDGARKNHLLSDDQVVTIRHTIVSRYIPSPNDH